MYIILFTLLVLIIIIGIIHFSKSTQKNLAKLGYAGSMKIINSSLNGNVVAHKLLTTSIVQLFDVVVPKLKLQPGLKNVLIQNKKGLLIIATRCLQKAQAGTCRGTIIPYMEKLLSDIYDWVAITYQSTALKKLRSDVLKVVKPTHPCLYDDERMPLINNIVKDLYHYIYKSQTDPEVKRYLSEIHQLGLRVVDNCIRN